MCDSDNIMETVDSLLVRHKDLIENMRGESVFQDDHSFFEKKRIDSKYESKTEALGEGGAKKKFLSLEELTQQFYEKKIMGSSDCSVRNDLYIEQPFAGYSEANDVNQDTDSEIVLNKKPKKKFKIAGFIGNVFFFAFITAIVVLVMMWNMNGENKRNKFGFSMFSVLSESMQSEIPKGSLIITKKIKPNSIKVGDTITFAIGENSSITHKVISIVENYNNTEKRGFQTKGIENSTPDENIVAADNVIGKVIFHIPYAGSYLRAINNYVVLIVLTLCGFAVTIWLLVYSFSNGNKNKKMSK